MLWCVLAIAVEEDHDVEPLLDGPEVPALLVSSVPQVLLMTDDRQGEIRFAISVPEPDLVSGILAVVVTDQYLGYPRAEGQGDPVEDLGQGRLGVVSDDQDPDARRFSIGRPIT
jgi:hypothetical protein